MGPSLSDILVAADAEGLRCTGVFRKVGTNQWQINFRQTDGTYIYGIGVDPLSATVDGLERARAASPKTEEVELPRFLKPKSEDISGLF